MPSGPRTLPPKAAQSSRRRAGPSHPLGRSLTAPARALGGPSSVIAECESPSLECFGILG
jgi:hypothetical protein